MGYNTKFEGVLKFTRELKSSELAKLIPILGEDCRDHPEWGAGALYYVDLKIADNFSGLEWDGSEGTYKSEIMDQCKPCPTHTHSNKKRTK